MVRSDFVLAQPLAEMMRHPFRQSSRIDENKRSPVFFDEVSEPVIDLGPYLLWHYRFQWRARQFDRHIELAFVSGVNDDALRLIRRSRREEVLRACLKHLLPLLLWRRGPGRGGHFLRRNLYFLGF